MSNYLNELKKLSEESGSSTTCRPHIHDGRSSASGMDVCQLHITHTVLLHLYHTKIEGSPEEMSPADVPVHLERVNKLKIVDTYKIKGHNRWSQYIYYVKWRELEVKSKMFNCPNNIVRYRE